jgi:hypothetical protein
MRALPLVILVVLILVALAVYFTVRAIRAKRAKALRDVGWYAELTEAPDRSIIWINRNGKFVRMEAVVLRSDPNHGDKVIEAFAAADTKAGDWNSTQKALV